MTSTPSTLSPRAREAVVAARAILEEDGVAGLTMRALADRLGIKAPSLYAHFRDKKAIENALIAQGLYEQAVAEDEEIAARPGENEIHAFWQGYRRWCLANPALHRLIASRDLDRDDEEVAAAERPGIVNVLRTTRGDRSAGIACWAFAFGMVELEISNRFPPGQDLEDVWRRGLDAIAATLPD